VNLDARRLRIAASKTDAGVRVVDLTPALQEPLTDYRARSPYNKPEDLVFPTSAGKRDNPSNARNRFLDSTAKLANADLRAAGREPMPDVTPQFAAANIHVPLAGHRGRRALRDHRCL
jgi:integrase